MEIIFFTRQRVFLENYVGRIWILRISREWRGKPVDFAYFTRMAWETYGFRMSLEYFLFGVSRWGHMDTMGMGRKIQGWPEGHRPKIENKKKHVRSSVLQFG